MLECPKCHRQIEAEHATGQQITCPHCNATFPAPSNGNEGRSDFVKDAGQAAKSLGNSLKEKKFNPLILVAVAAPVVMLFGFCMCCGMCSIFSGGAGDVADSRGRGRADTVNDGGVGTASSADAISVSAGELLSDYDNNEVAANQSYRGKIVEVSGTVNSIGEGWGSTYVAVGTGEEFELIDVWCYLADGQGPNAASLDTGQYVTIRGKCDGTGFGNVVLKNCVIVDR